METNSLWNLLGFFHPIFLISLHLDHPQIQSELKMNVLPPDRSPSYRCCEEHPVMVRTKHLDEMPSGESLSPYLSTLPGLKLMKSWYTRSWKSWDRWNLEEDNKKMSQFLLAVQAIHPEDTWFRSDEFHSSLATIWLDRLTSGIFLLALLYD